MTALNPLATLQALAPLQTSQPAEFAALAAALGIPATTPGQLSATITVAAGTGPYTILPGGLTLSASGWVFVSVNTSPVIATSGAPLTLQFNVATIGTAGAIATGTPLTPPLALTGVTAVANGTPTPSQGQTYPATDWEVVATTVAMLETFAQQYVDMNATILAIALAGFLGTAAGAPGNNSTLAPGQTQPSNSTWLDLLIESEYDIARGLGTVGQYSVTLTLAPSATPFTFQPGALAILQDGRRYLSTNAAPVTIAPGASVTQTFQSESVGADYNASITVPGTTLGLGGVAPGLTATAASYNNTGSSIVVAGVDVESDVSYLARAMAQWPSLIAGPTIPTFESFALNLPVGIASGDVAAAITSCLVVVAGTGTFAAYAANANLVPSPADIATVKTALFNARPLCTRMVCFAPTPAPVTVRATIYAPAAILLNVQAGVTIALAALQASLAIGDGSGAGSLRLSALYAAILSAGATACDITSPSSDTIPSLATIVQILTQSGGVSTLTFVAT